MADTNEKIALERGWTDIAVRSFFGGQLDVLCGISRDDDPGDYHKLPDFLHSWEHNGPLQEELWEAGFELNHDNEDGTFYWWRVGDDGPDALDDDREDETDVKVATALDWLAWKEEER